LLKLLFVSKDFGGTKTLVPIGLTAKAAGHEITVVCEGKGAPLWIRAGVEPYFMGSSDFETVPFSLNVPALFDEVKPDAAILEIPYSINLTKSIGLEANIRSIPVVIAQDYWSSLCGLPEVNPSLVLTIDEYAKKIAESQVNIGTPVRIIGNHAVPNLRDYQEKPEVLNILSEARKKFDKLFVYVGGHRDCVEPELKILIPSLEFTPGNWGLIPRYHPKCCNLFDKASGKKMPEIWDNLFEPIASRIVRCNLETSDDLAILCDACFSGISSSMSSALVSGKPAVSIRTPESMALLREVNLEEIPWVALGASRAIEQAQDLSPLLVPPTEEIRKKFRPLDASFAVRAIEELLL